MEGKSEKAGTDIFQKRCYKKKSKGEKKVVEMRRHWSVFAPTQHHFHCTCNQVLHKAFWGTQVSPFLVGKSQCITTGTLTTPSLYCILQIIFQCFWTLWIQRTCRGITHGNVMNLWHHDSFFLYMSRTTCKMTNSTHHTTVSSRPLFSFSFFSCTFLDPCSSINPTLHHLFSTHSSSSFSESISIPRHCKGASRSRAVIWQILPFSIVGLILRPGHVQNKYEPCMVVAHVLFVDDESRGDSICQFVCFLFEGVELFFSNFLFF